MLAYAHIHIDKQQRQSEENYRKENRKYSVSADACTSVLNYLDILKVMLN